MKIIKAILKILLPIFLIIITASFIIENIVIKTFSQEILSKKISGYFLDEIIYDFNVDELSKIDNGIKDSDYSNKITEKFIETIIKNLLYEKNEKLDIEHEIDSLISQNIPKSVSKEKVDNVKEYLVEQISDTEKRLEKDILYGFGDYYLTIFKIYNIFTNIYFRITILTLCFIDILCLIILEKYKSLKSIQISTFITAIVSLIMFIVIKILSNFIDQRLAGGWLSSINLNLLIIFIIIEFIISFILFIIRKKLRF